MRLFHSLLESPAIEIFGWALLHSIWQGFVLAILLKGALSSSKKISANARYLIACVTLLLMLAAPITTSIWSRSERNGAVPGKAEQQQPSEAIKGALPQPKTFAYLYASESDFELWLYRVEKQLSPWLVSLWLVGVFISSLRLFGAWSYTRRLKLGGKELDSEHWDETLQNLCRRMRVSRPVVFLESFQTKVPVVIGWLKPVVLIPSCALTGLTPRQLELILAHELAHVRRCDYLVNLFQTIVETLLFYHPVAWWVSKQIRNERENACDDLAVSLGDRVAYARTLLEVERLRKTTPEALAMAAAAGSLTSRVHRLIGVEASDSRRSAGVWLMIFTGILLAAVVIGVQSPTGRNSPAAKVHEEKKSLLNLPPLTTEDLREGATAAQNTMTGEWTAEINRDTPGEIRLEVRKLSKSGSINGSVNTLSFGELRGLTPEEAASEKTNVAFEITREAGSFAFAGYFGEGKGSGVWRLTPNQNFVSAMRSRGYDNLPENYLFYAAAENVTPELVDEMDGAGYGLSFKELIQAASYKITPESIKAWGAAGFSNPSFEELVLLGENEITPEFLGEIKAEGFGEISLRQAVKLKEYGIDRDFIRSARARGFPNLTLNELIELRINGVVK